MRRLLSVVLGLLVIGILGGSMIALAPVEAAPSPAPLNQAESSCVADGQKVANPKVLLLGETTSITLTVKAICAGEQLPLHIVLVLDASGSMAGDPNRQMKDAAKKLIERLNMRDNPGTQVGVVEFNGAARALCQLTNTEGQAKGCVSRVGANGGTNIGAGIREGLKVLLAGRRKAQDPKSLNEVMVVLSDGANNTGCGDVLDAARQAKSQGVLMISVCVGSGCDTQCMRQVASSARYFFEVDNASGLIQVFERIRKDLLNITLRKLVVIDKLPSNMEFIPGSDVPPAEVSASQDELKWEQNYIPKDGITLTFQVRPKQVGFWPTNVEALGTFWDNQNRTGTVTFPVPFVTVLQPFMMPTPTDPPPPPPSPTPTNTPTNTPTPTITPHVTPTNTPTPTPKPIYLPIMLREQCPTVEEYRYSDVALVLDMSTSMDRMTSAGRPKRDAVIESAKAFVNGMKFTPNRYGQHDQASVVWFNNVSKIEQTLTGDQGAVLAALDRLPSRRLEGTRLDLAFKVGAEALPEDLRKKGQGNYPSGRPIPDNLPVVIMLTDGLPNRVPFPTADCPDSQRQEDTVLCWATKAKAQGIRIYTIGVGDPDAPDPIDRVLPWLLMECASEPTMYYETPDAEQLNAIYAEIHAEFYDTCPADTLWGGRK